MTTHWAIDFGTSNTTVCEDRSGRPHIVKLPDLAKLEPVTQTPVMPTCVCVMSEDGSDVLIGQEAVTYNWDGQATGFARSFKQYLGTESNRTVARVGRRSFSAQDAAALFLSELVAKLEEQSGEKITDITIATPSGFYETYRAHLHTIVRGLSTRIGGSGSGPVSEARYDLLKAYEGPYRTQIVLALTEALVGSSSIHAARALREIHVVEALPALRTAPRSAGKRNDLGQAIVDTIQDLEARSALPRPAESVPAPGPTLPSSAGEPGSDPATLPRVSDEDSEHA